MPKSSSRPIAALVALFLALTTVLAGAGPASAEGTASISGTVTTHDGAAITALVVAYRKQDDGTFTDVAATSTDPEAGGTYVIEDLPAGEYIVRFTDNSSTHALQWFENSITRADATRLTLADGQDIPGVGATLGPVNQITGTMTDETGAGAYGSEITAYANTAHGWAPVLSTSAYLNGDYYLTGLPNGTYRLGFGTPTDGYTDLYWPDADTIESAADISLSDGAVSTGKNGQVARYGYLHGRVFSPVGGPLAAAEVTLYRSNGVGWTQVDVQTSGSNGWYYFTDLVPGTYRVGFAKDGFATEFWPDAGTLEGAGDLDITWPTSRTDVHAILAAAVESASIAGKVTGDTPSGVPGVTVVLYAENGSTWTRTDTTATTDGDGEYELADLDPGVYRLRFEKTGWASEFWSEAYEFTDAADIELSEGEHALGTNNQIGLAHAISGTVTGDGGATLGSVTVTLYRQTPFGWDAIATYFTDPDGAYAFTELPSGNYRLGLAAPGYLSEDWQDEGTGAGDVVVLSSSDLTLDPEMSSGGHVTGVVTDAEGEWIAGAVVSAYRETSPGSGDYNFETSTETAGDGSYDLGALSGGDYRLGFQADGYVGEFWDDSATLMGSTAFPVALGAVVSGRNASLAAGGDIGGTVTGRHGNPLGGIHVKLFKAGSDEPWAATYTDSDGEYEFAGYVAGDYRIKFDDLSDNVLDEYWNDRDTLEAADVIHLTAPGSATADAVLTDGAHITGTITSDAGGPVDQVRVVPYRWDPEWHSWDELEAAWTNADGEYDASGLSAGTYRLQLSATGFLPQFWGGARILKKAESITVAKDGVVTDRDAVLQEGGWIRGTVTNSGGEPLPGIRVIPRIWAGGNHWDELSSVHTNISGHYELSGLRAGTYRVEFRDQGGSVYGTEWWENSSELGPATNIDLDLGQEIEAIDAVLTERGTINGTVTGPGGVALSGVTVTAYDADGGWVRATSTAANGGYTLNGLDNGTYRLGFSADATDLVSEYWNNQPSLADASGITVVADSTVTGKDAELAEGGHITGTVTGPTGAAAEDVRVYVFSRHGKDWAYTDYADTDAAGHYYLGGLGTGTYRLRFRDVSDSGYLDEYWNGARTIEAGSDIAVTAGATTSGKDAQMEVGGVVTGTVTGPDDEPAEDVEVALFQRLRGGWVPTQAGATTDEDGNYRIEGLATGIYRLGFEDGSDHSYAPEFWDDATSVDAAPSIAVTAGTTLSGKDAKLAAGGHITGTVTGPDHSPVPDAGVRLYVETAGRGWTFAGSAGTDEAGHFDFGGLAAGEYRIGVSPIESSGLLPEFWNDAATVEAATSIQLASGATSSGRNVELAAGGTVTGSVISAEDVALAGVQVTARVWDPDEEWWQVMGSAETDASGDYAIRGLAAGSYRIAFEPAYGSGLAPEYWNNATTIELADDVTVTAGETVAGRDAVLAFGARVLGTVTGPTGLGADGVSVYLFRKVGDDWIHTFETETEEDGSYEFEDLPAGTYRIGFDDQSPHGYAREFWGDDAPTVEGATDVAVGAGETVSGTDAQLALGGRIRGTVTNTADAPLGQVDVVVYRQSGGEWAWFNQEQTNASGKYDVGELPAGVYRIRFEDDGPNRSALPEYWDDAATLATAAEIEVGVGEEVTGRDAQLADGGRITGTVTGPDDEPLDQIRVWAYQHVDDEWVEVGSTWTDELGAYTLAGLPSGTYRVGFRADRGNLATEYWNNAVTVAAATDIAVTAGSTTSGRDAKLALAPVVNATAPAISGTPVVGAVLSASTGSWTPATGLSLSYRWLVGGTAVPGATGPTYTPKAADLDKTVVVEVTAGKPAWVSTTKASAATGPVTLTSASVANRSVPTISGAVKVGTRLTATPGTWSPSAVTVSYQWLVGGKVAGTGASYTPKGADAGKTLQVRATASAAGRTPGTAVSKATTIGKGTLKQLTKPKLTGTAKKGATLSVSRGAWSPSAVTVSFQWYANGKAIAKATGATLKLTGATLKAVAGKTITVKVTVSATGYTPVTTTLTAPGKAKA